MTDSVAGVPVAGVSLLAELVGAAVLTGSVGVAEVDSVEGTCETDVAVSSLEQPAMLSIPLNTIDEIKNG
jgi:hypothetical protein